MNYSVRMKYRDRSGVRVTRGFQISTTHPKYSHEIPYFGAPSAEAVRDICYGLECLRISIEHPSDTDSLADLLDELVGHLSLARQDIEVALIESLF